ncbi:Piso0_003520 [Millerozyma farinosa CBS 7064]|uniref:Piso0_003520 protein n=1 Tax=Pichia sorbitophila (strain ATCC MYA-4447 / BCRC 22081 / CBS 7064 / NBRC 10061 / NRRL Y-12695) TaxID=559304 RepID=G8YIB7_PICSO|nr:Piso0_003520 [Millerozyma farinosa CBS 7064]CCE81169.1 Piso0_003520 [Millerozyma farinosa CBS 7064]
MSKNDGIERSIESDKTTQIVEDEVSNRDSGDSESRSPTQGDSTKRYVPGLPIIHNKLYHGSAKKNSRLKRLPSNVLRKLSNEDLRNVRSHTELAETANGVRMLMKNLTRATIQIDVKAIMIVTKARDNSLIYITREMVQFLLTRDKEITVYVDKNLQDSKRFDLAGLHETVPKAKTHVKFWTRKLSMRNPEAFDLVVTLGGDGTVLYVSNLFQRVVPPVISFALGSLGFLTNFEFDNFREKMTQVLESGVRAYLRMRLTCRVHTADGKLVCEQHVLNELVVDRGSSPYVTQLELYGDDSLLTIAQADGLIIATPTGSTAYSLSAGGSLVHPGVSAISVTPICPHTLSFRPILLPDGMFLKLRVPWDSRSTAWASFDGKVRTELCRGDYVTVQASPYPFPTVISSKTEYIDSVSRNLNWNAREKQKPLSSYLSQESTDMLNTEAAQADGAQHRGSRSSVPLDDDYDINYSAYDSSDSELNSPMPSSPNSGFCTPFSSNFNGLSYDERQCFAHPNAKISLNPSALNSISSSPLSTNSEVLTINPESALHHK